VDLTSAIEHVRPAIVQIQLRELILVPGNIPKSVPIGTGFLISDEGLIVTAKHVVDSVAAALAGGAPGTLGAIIAFAEKNEEKAPGEFQATFAGIGYEIIALSEEHDLALLKTLRPISAMPTTGIVLAPVPAELAVERPLEGELIAISGYPLSSPSLVTTAGSIGCSWVWDPTVVPVRERYIADVTANFGNSGGPVYRLSDGKVIGVCVGGRLSPIQNGQGSQVVPLTIVVPSKYVRDLVDGH
jgi:S1-C subfamily serine protease